MTQKASESPDSDAERYSWRTYRSPENSVCVHVCIEYPHVGGNNICKASHRHQYNPEIIRVNLRGIWRQRSHSGSIASTQTPSAATDQLHSHLANIRFLWPIASTWHMKCRPEQNQFKRKRKQTQSVQEKSSLCYQGVQSESSRGRVGSGTAGPLDHRLVKLTVEVYFAHDKHSDWAVCNH
jgi:hypothetical protein